MDTIEFLKTQKPTFLPQARKKGYVCPRCGNGNGSDGDGISLHPGTTKYKCFKCGFYGDVIDLFGEANQIGDKGERVRACAKYYGIDRNSSSYRLRPEPIQTASEEPSEDFTDFIEQAMQNNNYTYLEERGISRETQRHFHIGYAAEWRNPTAVQRIREKNGNPNSITPSPRCIIPRNRYSYLARDTRKDIPDEQKKYVKQNQGKVCFFDTDATSDSDCTFLVEGEIDAMSIYEVHGHAIGLCSTANVRAFLKQLESQPTASTLILMLDNDTAGRKAQEELAAGLQSLGVTYIEAEYTAKDPNDQLRADRAEFETLIASLREKAADARQAAGGNSYQAYRLLDYFRNIADQPSELEAKTGFCGLDDPDSNLQGGLHTGLYIIGAVSSLGKTTFCLQMADQIAANGQDVIFFSLEQSKYELMAKSISRYTYQKRRNIALAKDTVQILDSRRYSGYTDEEKKVIAEAIEAYESSAKRLYLYEGRYKGERLTVSAIRQLVRHHIETTKHLPVVFIDYLQILASEDPRRTDKQNIDASIFELKELSRDFHIPVVVISSFNRDNYQEPVSMAAFKESGAVEYSSDVLFGLQYTGMDYVSGEGEKVRRDRLDELMKEIQKKKIDKTPIDIELKCLKNRNGMTFTLPFRFLSCYNHYEESVPHRPWNSSKPTGYAVDKSF